jgi:hypothetical protein
MYEFIYGYLINKYKDNIILNYIETDAVMFKVKT